MYGKEKPEMVNKNHEALLRSSSITLNNHLFRFTIMVFLHGSFTISSNVRKLLKYIIDEQCQGHIKVYIHFCTFNLEGVTITCESRCTNGCTLGCVSIFFFIIDMLEDIHIWGVFASQ